MDHTDSLSERRVLDDRYELIEPVGSGGMAEVWRARDLRLGRDVAVKLLSGPGARDESRRRRIEREARALATASHPNIVAVYDYGEADDDVPYIAMELVDGPDLHRHLAQRGPLPVDEALEIMNGVLGAVAHAHTAGVVHGDLKPANVFIGSHGPKVGDFGVARIMSSETGATTVAATPTCAAPEVLKGERPSPAADVYSASCLMYELLTGRPPYSGANGWEITQKHIEAPIPSVRAFRSDVPVELDEAIQRGLAKDPARRHADAGAFASAMDVPLPPAHDETVPVAAAGIAPPTATQVITKRTPDLARVAVLGPLAGVWERARALRPEQRRLGLALLTALIVVLLLVAMLAMREDRLDPVAVPNVVGDNVQDASAALKLKGFGSVSVSYRPVTEGDANRVLATIPAAKAIVEPGSNVHLIASARTATPAPTRAPAVSSADDGDDGDDRPARDPGKRNGKRKRD